MSGTSPGCGCTAAAIREYPFPDPNLGWKDLKSRTTVVPRSIFMILYNGLRKENVCTPVLVSM
jgi:hypothetical protein